MDALIPLFVAVFLSEAGGRTQTLMLTAARAGAARAFLIPTLIAAVVGYAVAAVGGLVVRPFMPSEARDLLTGVALLAAGLPLFFPVKPSPDTLPQGLGGRLWLIARSIAGDAGQFLVFALAARTGSPFLAVLGATLGMAVACMAPVIAAKDWPRSSIVRLIRIVTGVVIVLVGFLVAVSALGIG